MTRSADCLAEAEIDAELCCQPDRQATDEHG